jgi:cytidyltransferase-like protein
MKRVIAFGTFDIFHPGHQSFLNQAKKFGGYLLVVVARDINTTKVKGSAPRNQEAKRALQIRKSKIADKVILGSKTNNYFRTLRTHKIDTIALGYDQKPTIAQLKKSLIKHRLKNIEIKRLRSYNPSKYKSSKLAN